MNGRALVVMLVSGAICTGVVGCAGMHGRISSATPASDERAVSAPPSLAPDEQTMLRPGLVISVSVVVAGKRDIDEPAKRVSEASTLTLPLLGAVPVKGMTLGMLSAELVRAYREYFVNPQVSVDFARDLNNEELSPWGYVTVLGRVRKPGRVSIPATRDMTVSGAIQQAGGYDTSAKDTTIRVTRRNTGSQSGTLVVNLRAAGADGRTDQDVVVQPNDVIFVPTQVF